MSKKISPLAFGLDPNDYNVGTIKEGVNNLIWIVEQKKLKKKWVRIEDMSLILTYEEPLIKNSKFQKFFIENIKCKSFDITMHDWYNIKNQIIK